MSSLQPERANKNGREMISVRMCPPLQSASSGNVDQLPTADESENLKAVPRETDGVPDEATQIRKLARKELKPKSLRE
jgi:hypothetical protein